MEPKKAFRLAQQQVKEQPQGKSRLDGDIGIDGLGASLAGHWRSPGGHRLWTDPQRDIVAIAQRLLIRVPVSDAISCFIFGSR